jgi:hypothetical protein
VTQKTILIGKTRNYAAFNAALFKGIWYHISHQKSYPQHLFGDYFLSHERALDY